MSSSDSVRVGGARRGRAQLGPRRHDVDGTAPDVAPAPQPDGDAVGRKVALGLGLSGYLMQCYSFFTVVLGYGTIAGGLARHRCCWCVCCSPVQQRACR